ncbi:NAD-dependent epimerase/dehydratase family protein [Ancylobacter dichloromethanicus]|uniref:NAD-dependent dehydratase n=1 Tax=Ancylobacter dichloromethanicus TaxID=518825 RepID=A0A9W6J8L7_9HYPH|nr:NAD-dependent epimerase/dehydratase family protein [Ancylobacter dichloromethanicus]MBS7553699.1 NAD-dependent epimerase/dehydratase family protein [Ancylobacter dichloromethanicus]GLK72767.1 NAD-dependent dehydratase [Ancylobacter dichloromethanicus]
MHVLLTGAAGFIGRHVLAQLLERGHEIRALDSLRPDVHRSGAAWAAPRDVEARVGDVRDAAFVAEAVNGVDAVIHLAAKVGLGVDIDDMPDYASSNDVGTAELLAAMARAGVSRLTLASSMVVYGEGFGRCPEHGAVRPGPRLESALVAGDFEPPCPICARPLAVGLVDEETSFDPRNAYATSKAAQELYAANWARATGGSAAMMRYHNVYGPGMPRDTPYAGVASIFTSALRRGEAPRVFEDGRQRRDFVHVRDVAAATVRACERHTEGVRAYNVGSGTPRTVGDMAQALAQALDGPPPVVTGQYRLGDVRHITADSSRLRRELGWTPTVDFADGMAELAALSQELPARPRVAAG